MPVFFCPQLNAGYGFVFAFFGKTCSMTNWIGCSGYHYKHWIDIFYPKGLPQSKWFDFYLDHFNTLELNVTFYRFPRLPFLESLYQRSHDNFTFSAKVPKAITHFKQFHQCNSMVADFYGLLREGLKHKLGAVLFQLPGRASYKPEKLERILEVMDPSFTNVLECRHMSWWNAEVFNVLSANNVSFCGLSHPLYPAGIIGNTTSIYYRFHGLHELYKSPYTTEELQEFVSDLKNSPGISTAYIYFNNDIEGNAIRNAKQLVELLKSE